MSYKLRLTYDLMKRAWEAYKRRFPDIPPIHYTGRDGRRYFIVLDTSEVKVGSHVLNLDANMLYRVEKIAKNGSFYVGSDLVSERLDVVHVYFLWAMTCRIEHMKMKKEAEEMNKLLSELEIPVYEEETRTWWEVEQPGEGR